MRDKLDGVGRPKKDEPTDPIRMPRSLARRIRRLAAHKNLDAGDYLAGLISKTIDDQERAMLKEIERDLKAGK